MTQIKKKVNSVLLYSSRSLLTTTDLKHKSNLDQAKREIA